MPRSSLAVRATTRHQFVLTERADYMRLTPTGSEARLFEALRGGKLGITFRRQVPLLGRFIVDLLAPAVRLVIEIDGGYRADGELVDARRDRALLRAGTPCCTSKRVSC